MYEQSAKWNTYYAEQEPGRRLKLLEELMLTQPDDGANEYRRLLFARRYEDPKTPGTYVDRFLFQCVNFVQIYKSARVFKRSAAREVDTVWRDLLLDRAGDYGPAGEKALYWELRSASARYFLSCQSPDYAQSLFGFMKSGDVNRQERMCRDAWEMSAGVSTRLGKQQQMRIWNEAVRDSYLMTDGSAGRRWEKMQQQNAQK